MNDWLTPELMKELGISEDDFCGAPGNTTGLNDSFRFACMMHDKNYSLMKNGDPCLRKQVDSTFLKNMITIIQHKKAWWLYPKAFIYYALVRIAGWHWWNSKNELNKKDKD